MRDTPEQPLPSRRRGPLAGVRVVEVAALGPAPFCGMLLADLGADVVRVDRPTGGLELVPPELDLLNRGKRGTTLNLADESDRATFRTLVDHADVLLEGFRPGVMERLRIGPEIWSASNPGLVYARASGWGQTGPLSAEAGHDINFIALSGLLHAIGPADGPPQVPLNVVGDFAGGAYLAIGVLAAVVDRHRTGLGQVVDAAMVDSAVHLSTFFHSLMAAGSWVDRRGSNIADGAAPFYGVYRTSDGGFMAVGAVEEQFYTALVATLGLGDPADLPDRAEPANWPQLRALLAATFATRTRDAWAELFAGTDACVTPVQSLLEARTHPHLTARGTFIEVGGIVQPAPAPRFSRRSAGTISAPDAVRQQCSEIVRSWTAEHV